MIEMMLLKKAKIIVGLVTKKIAILIASTAMTMTTVLANPTGGVVTSGSATIVQAPNTTQIHQGSDKAIIHWQSFNINAAEKTQFIQPSRSSVILNRIDPKQGASQIFGQLNANGRIILVNQAGIYFGPGSRVDVGGIIASTSDIKNQNFLAGKFIFDQPAVNSGSIVNKGTITSADYGLVALMGKNVVNDGVINARLGNVVLASGNKFTLDFYGDQLINFSVDEAAEKASVKNSGAILADGGTVRISARSAQGVVDNVINMKGVVQANSVSQRNGVIILDGGNGTVTVAGHINASGKQYGQRGGKVKILAKKVRVQAPTVIDVSGDIGGGEILIGGNYQGKGLEQNALSTTVDSGVVLAANAIRLGNGGKVVAWSDGETEFHGSIFARGGALGGHGGAYVETSGHVLDISGAKVDLSAPKGKAGLWLIDPTDITISGAATSGESFGSGTYTPSGATANILNTELNANLALSNILVTTASADGSAGTITVSAPITWLSTNTLTLRSNSAITINSAISGANGGLTLEAGLLAGTPASITTGAGGTINVGTFNLAYGNWSQVGTLPAFHATDFRLNNGNGPSNNVSFIRALSGDGGGTPYLLTDIYGVEGMGSNATTLGYNYELNNNIDASGTTDWNSGAGFRPIGITNIFNGGGSLYFTGSLNGNDYAIDSLYIGGIYDDFVRPDTALIAGIDLSASISNIGLTNININVTNASGGNDMSVGALVGTALGAGTSITNAYSTGTIKVTGITLARVGGLIGAGYGSVSDSFSLVNVTNTLSSGNPISVTGGFIGGTASSSLIERSYSGGSVSAVMQSNTTSSAGGFVGENQGQIHDSYSYGSVSSRGRGTNNVGGFVGTNTNTITNSYSSGLVTNLNGPNVGGFVGNDLGGTYSNNFWDTETSGQASGAGATGRTTAQMMDYSTFNGAGWDITNIPSVTSTAPSNIWYIFDRGSDVPGVPGTRPMLMMEHKTNITNAHQMQMVGTTLGADYTLANDIDLESSMTNASDVWATNKNISTGIGWVPIGQLTDNVYFTGDFEGNNHVINHLYINTPQGNLIGLFGIFQGSTIQNLGVINADVTATVGGASIFAGEAWFGSTVNNVYTTGTATGAGGAAGLMSVANDADISNSYSTATVSGGGIQGGLISVVFGNATISNSYATGNVTGTAGATYTGGLIGNNFVPGIGGTIITNSYSSGAVTGAGILGGLLAGNFGNEVVANNSFWDTTTSGLGSSAVGTGKTTAELLTMSTYSVPGWSITSTPGAAATWFMLDGNTRPMLQSEYNTTINTAHQLQLMSFDLAANYTLGSNIDASGTSNASDVWATSTGSSGGFVPVGTLATPFTGSFDGQNHTIDGLYVHRDSLDYIGLFGMADIGSNAIENVGVINETIRGGATPNQGVGGLVGYIGSGTIRNAYTTGSVTLPVGSGCNSDCGTGGLVGQAASGTIITGSHSDATVTSDSLISGSIGGLIGFTAAALSDSYATGNVISITGAGGLAGFLSGTVNRVYSSGNVTAAGEAGGLAGFSDAPITDAYSTGNVTLIGAGNVGGLLGRNNNVITNAYSSGAVSGGTTVGGLVGVNNGDIVNSFWDTDTSLQAEGYGANFNTVTSLNGGCFGGVCGIQPGVNSSNPGAAVNLADLSTYNGAGWDITSTPSITSTAPSNFWFLVDRGTDQPGLAGTRPMLMMEYSTNITNAHQLQLAASTVGADYTLANDIDLSSGMTNASDVWGTNSNASTGAGWVPIGELTGGYSYTGTFEGNNHLVSNLYMNTTQTNYIGLFGIGGPSSLIQNLGVVNANVNAAFNAGILAGQGGNLINVFTTGALNVTNGQAGGLTTNAFHISKSFNAATVRVTINNGGSYFVGGLAGAVTGDGTIRDSYNTGAVIVTGSDPSATVVGGLVGDMYTVISDGLITRSFNSGLVSAPGAQSVGGLLGRNTEGSGVITASFWDTATSGQAAGIGAGTAVPGAELQAGTFDGSSGVNLSQQATYTGAGWTFDSNYWGIIEGQSYPYLASIFTSTPRAISGTITGDTGGSTVQMAINGVINGLTQSTGQTGANGFYYFLQPNAAIPDGSAILTYLTGGSNTANAVTLAPSDGGSITGLNSALNTVGVGDSSTQTLTNSTLSAARGALVSPDILYTAAGLNLTFTANKNFATTNTTTYTVDGDLDVSAGTGTITFDGPSVTGNSNISLGSGSLTVNNSLASSLGGVISGSGGLTKQGSGTLTLSGTNLYTGATSVNAGILSISADANLGAAPGAATPGQLTLAGGTLQTTGSFTLASNRGIALGAGNGTLLTAPGTTLTYNGIIAGANKLTKSGTGTLSLGGANTFGTNAADDLTISAGQVTATNASALGGASRGTTVTNGAALALNGSGMNLNNNLTLNGSGIGGTGSLVDISVGGAGNSIGGTVVLASNTTIGVTNSTGSLLLGSPVSGAFNLTKVGSGRLILAASNTYGNGGTTTSINEGTVEARMNTSLGNASNAVTVASGAVLDLVPQGVTLNIDNPITLNGTGISSGGALVLTNGSANLNGNVVLGSATSVMVNSPANTLTLAGTVSGAQNLRKLGTRILALTGNNTFGSGSTFNVDAGDVVVTTSTGLGDATNAIVFASGGSLHFTGNGLSIANSMTLNGSGTGTGVLNDYSGSGSANTLSGNISLGSSSSIVVNNGSTLTLSGVISGGSGSVLNVENTNGTLVLSGNNTYSGATSLSAGTLRISSDANLGSAPGGATPNQLQFNGGTLETTADFTLNANRGIALNSTGNFLTNTGTTLTYNGVIAGTGGLNKTGAGTLLLGGANSYSGITAINAGTLRLGASGVIAAANAISLADAAGAIFDLNGFNQTIGSIAGGGTTGGNVSLGAGTLTTGNSSDTTYAGIISGSGALVKSGSGIFTLSGANTYAGGTTLSQGTLNLGVSSTGSITNGPVGTGTLTLNGGTLTSNTNGISIANAFALSSSSAIGGSNSLTLSGTGVLTSGTLAVNNTNTTTLGGALSGGGNLSQSAGTLIMSGSNSYSGSTTLSGGALQANNATNPFGTGVLNLNGGTLTALTGTTLGNSSFAIASGAAATIGGTNNITITNNGSFGDSSSSLTATNTGGIVRLNGVLSGAGSVTRNGAGGGLIFGGQNTYSGTTTITAGSLITAVANAMSSSSDVSLANTLGATLNINGFSQTIANLSGGGNSGGGVALGAGTLTITEAGNTIYAGTISGTGGITKEGAGTLTLNHSNAYTGTTTVNNGTLQIGAPGAINFASAVNVGASGTLDLNNISLSVATLAGSGSVAFGGAGTGALTTMGNGSTTFSGVISGSGTLGKQGSGTLILSGLNTYGGLTTVTGGTIQLGINNAIGSGSAVNVSSGGTFDLNNFNDTILALTSPLGSGGSVLLGSGTLTTAGNNTTAFYGVISGSGGLTKQGSGTLSLFGTNLYTGTTTINGGTIALGAAGVLADTSAVSLANTAGATFNLAGFNETIGSLSGGGTTGGNISLGGGTLTVNQAADQTYAGVISGTGGLTKAGSSRLTLSGTNLYTGTTTINAGTLQLGASGAIVATNAINLANVAGAIFDLNGFNQTIGSLSGGGATGGNVSLGAGTLTTGNGINTTYAGVISGSGGLTKQGAGIFTLSGANAYTGATNINAGTLRLGAAGVIDDTNAVTLADVAGAIFNLNGFNETIGSLAGGGTTGGDVSLGAGTLTTGDSTNTTYSGVISGSGGLTKQGSGIFTIDGANAYTGATSINAGTLRLGAAAVIADTSAVSLLNVAGAIFNLNGFNETIGSLAGGGTTGGNVSLGAGTLTTGDSSNTTYAGVISGSGGLTKQGSGIFTLSGTNLYTGDTTINAGILRLGAASVIADTNAMTLANVAGAIFDLNGFSETIGSLSGGGTTGGDISLGAGTLTVGDASNTTYSGTISGSGGLNKVGTGTLILNTDNNYTGTTSILNGTLELGADDAIPASSALNIASTGTLGLGGFDKTFAGLSGDGNINLGTATLTINNAVDTVYDGVLSGSGNLIKQGTGMLTLNSVSNYTGTTLLDINGGTLQLGVANALSNSSAVTLSSGSTLDLNGFNTVVNDLSGSGSVTLGSGMLTANNSSTSVFSGNITGSGGLIKSGAGVLTLSGNNGFTGATSIDAGVLSLVNNTGLATSSGTTVASGAALNISNTTVTLNPISLAGGILTSTGTSVLNGNINLAGSGVIDSSGSLALNGNISGAAGLTLQGTGTITLANSLSGLSSLTSTANQLTLNGGAVSTTGNQSYINTLVLGVDTTMTVGNNSSIALPAVVIGNLTLAGGSNSSFSAPSKASGVNTINITGGGAGFINDPIYFGGFQTINGLGNTSVYFNALAKNLTYDSSTGIVSALVGNMTFFFINIPLSAFSGNIEVIAPDVVIPNSIINTNSAIVQLMAQMTSSTGGLSVVQDQPNQTDNTSAMSDSYNAFSNYAVTQNITLMLDEVNSSVQKEKEKQTFGICPI